MPAIGKCCLRSLLSAILLLGLLREALSAQERQIPPAPTCPQCSIHIRKVAELRPGSSAQPMLGSRVARSRAGLFFVAPTVENGVIAVYDAQGRFLRALGRRGDGPGEFDDASALAVSPADSLYLLHHGRRFSVLGPDGTYARSFTSPASINRSHLLVPRDGEVLIAGGLTEPGREFLLYRLDRDGKILQTMRREPLHRTDFNSYSALSIGHDGAVLAAPTFDYIVDRYAESGEWQTRFERELSWFPRDRSRRPKHSSPRVNALATAPNGQIWVSLSRPDPDWKPPPSPPRDAGGETRAVQLSASQVIDRYDHVLELFDPTSGRIVARSQLSNRYVAGFLDGDHLYTHREDENGEITVEVWRLALLPPPVAVPKR